MTFTRALAEFATSDIEPASDALEMIRLSTFDWASCAIAGIDEPVSKITRQMIVDDGGAAQSTAFGADLKVPMRAAALLGGVTSHALDYDDTHFAHIGHPSVAVLPAALAVAEAQEATGEEFLRAGLIGAELSVRSGVWLGRGHYQLGFHQTGTAGCFGATAAAGVLLGLDEDQMCHALGLAATKAAGLKSQFGTMGKPYNAGQAAAYGVEAALLASRGFISNPDGLDAEQGFGDTHGGAGDLTALDGIGTDWLFEQVSHKFHACCHGTHAMIEALLGARCDPSNIERIVVATNPRWMRVCNIAAPRTGLEAKFSYRLIAALVLEGHDTADLSTFSDEFVQEQDLVALRDKVTVVGDEGVGEMEARVAIVTRKGDPVAATHDLAAPVKMSERGKKLLAKSRALIGEDEAEALATAVFLEDALDLDALVQALAV